MTPTAAAVDRMAAACLKLLSAPALSGEVSAAAYDALMALHDGLFGDAPLPTRVSARSHGRWSMWTRMGGPLGHRAAGLGRGPEPAHFTRKFSAEAGTSPFEYALAARIELAKRLLIATDQPVSAIAEATGFANGNYFAKAFRRQTGSSPSQFRTDAAGG